LYFVDNIMADTFMGMGFSNESVLDGRLSPYRLRVIGRSDGAACSCQRETPVRKFGSVACAGLVSVLFL
jgi:hypothetical protein